MICCWSGERGAHQGGYAHHGHAAVCVLVWVGCDGSHHFALRLNSRDFSRCASSTSNFHLSPPASAGAYVVFAVSPISLTIVTVGVYTLSVITLVFFVYSVANRSNFGRCSRPSDAFAFLITRCVLCSVGVLVFLVLGALPPCLPASQPPPHPCFRNRTVQHCARFVR